MGDIAGAVLVVEEEMSRFGKVNLENSAKQIFA